MRRRLIRVWTVGCWHLPPSLSAGSSALFNCGLSAPSTGAATPGSVGDGCCGVQALLVLAGLRRPAGADLLDVPAGARPASSRSRTRAGSSSNVQLPDSASLQRTQEAVAQIDQIARETPGVAHTLDRSPACRSCSRPTAPNFGSMFVILDPFDKRQSPELRDTAIMAQLRPQWARQVKDAQVTVFGAPPVPGLGVAGGFKLMVEDRGGLGLPILAAADRQPGRQAADSSPGWSACPPSSAPTRRSSTWTSTGPRSRRWASRSNDVNQTLQIYLGSLYVNSFNAFGRHWQVNVQAEGEFRNRVDDINLLAGPQQPGADGPAGHAGQRRARSAARSSSTRYNLYTAAPINGNLQPGVSSGRGHRGGRRAGRRDPAAVDEQPSGPS